jgi:hypothetical protein
MCKQEQFDVNLGLALLVSNGVIVGDMEADDKQHVPRGATTAFRGSHLPLTCSEILFQKEAEKRMAGIHTQVEEGQWEGGGRKWQPRVLPRVS